MKTFNRGKLRKLAAAGKLLCVDYYHFDDMYGAERKNGASIPVVYPKPADWHDRTNGILYLDDMDFRTKSGCCWENPNGTITLIIHSNLNYTFKVKEAA